MVEQGVMAVLAAVLAAVDRDLVKVPVLEKDSHLGYTEIGLRC